MEHPMYRVMLVDDEHNILNALRRLEEESPGITKVNWGPDGSVILDEDDVAGSAGQEADKWLNSTK